MGLLYEGRKGVPQDYGKAREYFVRAGALDNVAAMNRLVILYHDGLGGPKDEEQSRYWSERAVALEKKK
jgi:TPR repeat protein